METLKHGIPLLILIVGVFYTQYPFKYILVNKHQTQILGQVSKKILKNLLHVTHSVDF